MAQIETEAALTELMSDLASAAGLMLGVADASVWRHDADRQILEGIAFSGGSDRFLGPMALRDYPNFFAALAEAAKPVPTGTSLDVGIWVSGQPWGILRLNRAGPESSPESSPENSPENSWSRQDCQTAVVITDLAALAILAFQKGQAEARLMEVEQRYRGLLDSTSSGLFQLDETGTLVDANRTLLRLCGFSDLDAARRAAASGNLPHFIDGDRRAAFESAFRRNEDIHDFEAELERADGSRFLAALSLVALLDAATGEIRRHGSIEDLTERRRLVGNDGLVDALTRLPNRAQFRERLKAAERRREADPSFGYGLLCLDCDQLQEVNEWLGHSGGDALLAALAHRLSGSVRDRDLFARLRSDEFVLLVEGMSDPAVLVTLAERLRSSLAMPLRVMGHDVFQSVSIGMAWSCESLDSDAILRDASIAMHRAKDSGRGKILMFEPSMRTEAAQRLQIETDLRQSLERGEFEVVYQPIVSAGSGALLGFEALVRWNHPTRGFLTPAAFIPHAERSGLIVSLDRWVLDEACAQLARWRAEGGAEHLTMSVNLSPVGVGLPDLIEAVDASLARHGLPGSALKLELTETALLSEPTVVDAQLRALRSRGIAVMIDDFGTGYSSLSHLHRYPVDGLKIDRRFVASAAYDRMSGAIVTAVVTLARALDMSIVAEGVEDADQLAWLGDFPDLALQGFHFARPLSADLAGTMISDAAALSRTAAAS